MANKNSMYKPFSILLTIFSPIYALPFILVTLSNNNRLGYLLFAFSLAAFSYVFIPFESSDLYRYYIIFEHLSETSTSSVNDFLIYRADKGVYYLMKLFSMIGLNMQHFVFAINLFTMSSLLLIFNDVSKNMNLSKKLHAFYFILFISSVGLIGWFLTSSRFFFGATLVITGYYLYYVKNKKHGMLYFIIAPFFHFSTLLFLIITFIPFGRLNEYFLRRLLIFSLIFYLIPSDTFSNLISENIQYLNNDNFIRKVEGYTLDVDTISNEILSNSKNIFLQFFFFFWDRFWVVFAIYFCIKQKNIPSYIYVFLIILNFLSPFSIVYGRYSTIFRIIFTLFLIKESYNALYISKFLISYFMVLVISFSISFRKIRFQLVDVLTSKYTMTSVSLFSKELDSKVIESKWDFD